MKNLKTFSVLVAGVAAAALVCQSALGAAISFDTVYTSVLPSTVTPGAAVTINWEVWDTPSAIPVFGPFGTPLGVYTYEYQVVNGYTAPDGTFEPGAAGLDSLNVTYDNRVYDYGAGYGNTPFGVASGTINTLHTAGASWLFGALAIGASTAPLTAPSSLLTSSVLWFASPLPPTLSDAEASGGSPSSPFASGDQVAVPNPGPPPPVPDGGMTLSMLGFAFMGVEGLRRKLGK